MNIFAHCLQVLCHCPWLVNVITTRLSTGRASGPWPEGWPGLALKGPGPGPDTEGLAPQMRAKSQCKLKGQIRSDPGQARTYGSKLISFKYMFFKYYSLFFSIFFIESHRDQPITSHLHHHHHHNHDNQDGQ